MCIACAMSYFIRNDFFFHIYIYHAHLLVAVIASALRLAMTKAPGVRHIIK